MQVHSWRVVVVNEYPSSPKVFSLSCSSSTTQSPTTRPPPPSTPNSITTTTTTTITTIFIFPSSPPSSPPSTPSDVYNNSSSSITTLLSLSPLLSLPLQTAYKHHTAHGQSFLSLSFCIIISLTSFVLHYHHHHHHLICKSSLQVNTHRTSTITTITTSFITSFSPHTHTPLFITYLA